MTPSSRLSMILTVSALFGIFNLAAAGGVLALPTWSRLDADLARGGHVAVLDSTQDRVLVLGDRTDEVWALSLSPPETWTRIPIEGDRPPARGNQSVVHDPVHNRWLLLRIGAGIEFGRAEIWELPLAGELRWRLVDAGTGPPYRNFPAVAFDAKTNRLLVYGGTWYENWYPAYGEPLTYLTDYWEFHFDRLSRWVERPLAGARPIVGQGSATFLDHDRRRMLIIGNDLGGAWGSTRMWGLSLEDPLEWQVLVPYVDHEPLPIGFGATMDPGGDRIVMHGGHAYGYTHGGLMSDAVTTIDLATNTTRRVNVPYPRPPGRWGMASVHDPRRDRHLFLGGWRLFNRASPIRESWEFRLGAGTESRWSRLGTAGGPPFTRDGETAVYDPRGQRLIVWGGEWEWPCMNYYCSFAVFNDAWGFDLSSEGSADWNRLPLSVQPSGLAARTMATMTLDRERNRLLVFGGAGHYDRLVYPDLDGIALDAQGAAGLIAAPSPAPGPRYAHAAVRDERRGRLYVFDGITRYVFPAPVVADAWSFDMRGEPAWSSIPLDPTQPTPGLGIQAVFDDAQDVVIAVTPPRASGAPWGAWEWRPPSSNAWTLLPVDPVAGPRGQGRAVFDPVGRALLFFEDVPATGTSTTSIRVWSLERASTTRWTPVATGPAPTLPALATRPVVYDALHDRFVVAGVGDVSEVWALTRGTPRWPITLARPSREAVGGGGSQLRIQLRSASPSNSSIHPQPVDLDAFEPTDLEWSGVISVLAADGTPLIERSDVDGDGAIDWTARVRRDPGANPEDPIGLQATNAAGAQLVGTLESPVAVIRPDAAAPSPGLRLVVATASTGGLRLALGSDRPATIELSVFDVRGRRVAERAWEHSGGGAEAVTLPELRNLPAGVYHVRAAVGVERAVARIVLLGSP